MLKRFSQRKGLRPLLKDIQRDKIDIELRGRLWTALIENIFNHWSPREYTGYQSAEAKAIDRLTQTIWVHHFKFPLDSQPQYADGGDRSVYGVMRKIVMEGPWEEVYDFIEFTARFCPSDQWRAGLQRDVNIYLEEENAAYRLVGSEIVEITDDTEISAIETALEKGVSGARAHLQRALELMSDKKSPDYRNAVKEAISAVEATCRVIAGSHDATLGDALKALRTKAPLHGAFEKALLALYGFTSDSGGIRHSLTEDTTPPSFADTKFMLVACSGFCNYLLTKAAEAGIAVK